MTSLFAPPPAQADIPPPCSLKHSTEREREQAAVTGVGAVRQAEDELDDAIDTLRTMAALAQDRGDTETAFDFTRRMLAASRSRTAEHQDRLAREHLAAVERSLDEGCCYFSAEGDKAADRLERKAA